MAENLDRKTDDDYAYIRVPSLLGGINTAAPADLIPDSDSPNMSNVFFRKNRVIIDTGYVQLGQAVLGSPRRSYQFERQSGSQELLLVTNTTMYKWISAVSEWQFVSSSVSTTLSGNEASGQTVLSVTSETGFVATRNIGIVLDNGKMHMAVIASTAAGTITIDVGLPSAAASGNAVLQAVNLAGSDTLQVDITTVSSNDWAVFTNGVDTPQKYDGTTVDDVPGLVAAFTTFTAKSIAVFKAHLVFLHTTENGTIHPVRVRNSDTADPSNWTTGNAGFTDLFDTGSPIASGKELGPYLIVYHHEAITRAEFVGSTDVLFSFDTMIKSEGTRSVYGVVDVKGAHVFVGNQNIYRYRGDFELEAIGDKIFFNLFSVDGEVDPSARDRIMAVFIPETREVMILFPRSGIGITKAVRLFLDKQAFSVREFSVVISGFGFFTKFTATTWATALGSWADQNVAWNARNILAASPLLHLLTSAGNKVFEYDYVTPTEDGAAITYLYETKDFGVPDRESRIDFVDVMAKGTAITVDYSLNEGSTWANYGSITAGMVQKTRLYKQVVGRSIRFRFSGSGGGFALHWFGILRKDEGLHPLT